MSNRESIVLRNAPLFTDDGAGKETKWSRKHRALGCPGQAGDSLRRAQAAWYARALTVSEWDDAAIDAA